MIKRILLGLTVLLAVLVAVVLVRTLSYSSRQIAAEAPTAYEIEETAAVQRLAGALRFATVSPEDPMQRDETAFADFRAYLVEVFPRAHSVLRREEVGNGSLLYTWPGSDPRRAPILLMGHYDVVPVEEASAAEWPHPPFAGVVADGVVWGRGALDDKGGVVGILEAVELLLARGFQPQQTIYLAFGADEEVGGMEGMARIAALLESRGVRPEWILDEGGLIVEGTVPGVDAPVALVGIAEKGYATLELAVEAEGGHSSTPPRQTAVGILGRAVARLEADPFPDELRGAAEQLFAYVGPEMPFAQRLVFANLWLFRPLVERQLAAAPATDAALRTTTAATVFQGGVKSNVLPSHARALVNFRILPGDSVAGVVERVRQVVDDPRVRVRLADRPGEPSPVSSLDAEGWELLQRTIRQVFPEAVVAPYLTLAATDTRHVHGLSSNVYRFLPLRADNQRRATIHGAAEHVPVADYLRAVRFYAQLMENSDPGSLAAER